MLRVLFILGCFLFHSLNGQEAIVIGIAGGTGSGKTTLADKIQAVFPDRSILISQDSYYKDLSHLSMEEREVVNFDHPSSLDFDLLKEHLLTLKSGQSIEQPIYNFCTHSRENKMCTIEPAPLIIVEGILLFAVPELRDSFNLKIYLDTDADIRVLRRIERDINERARQLGQVMGQYLATVKPMHDAFVAPSKQYADIIVPNARPNEAALSIILAKLNEDLAQHKVQELAESGIVAIR